MHKEIYPYQLASEIQVVILKKYGEKVYGDKSSKNVSRRYNLSHLKLKDIFHVCGTMVDLERCETHLRNHQGDIHEELTPTRLLYFMKIARLGRCAIAKQNHEPSFFVHSNVLSFAQQLRTHLLREEVSA